MGQYHGLFNLDKREMVFPHELGYGAKQWEHTGFAGSLSDVLYALCAYKGARGGGDFADDNGTFKGRWHGDRVAVIGDYAEISDLPEAWHAAFVDHEYNGETHKVFNMVNQYGEDEGTPFFNDIGGEIRPFVAKLWEKEQASLLSLREKYADGAHIAPEVLAANTR
jgi:hypothetical protein